MEDVVGNGDVLLEVDDFDHRLLAALHDDGFQREALVGPDGPFDGLAVRDDDVGVFVAGPAHAFLFAEVFDAIFFGHFIGDVEEVEVGHRVGRLLAVDLSFLDVECPDAVLPRQDAIVVGHEVGNVHRLDIAFESAVIVDVDGAFRHLSAEGGLLRGDARLEAVFLESILCRSAEGDGQQEEKQECLFHGDKGLTE